MKYCILLLSFFFISLITKAQQTIENFESFHNYTAINPFVPLSVPNGWSATDSLVVTFGALTNLTGTFQSQVKKVAGHIGTGALQVNTKIQDSFLVVQQGPLMAACFNGALSVNTTSGAFTITGGYPIGGRPATLQFWYKTICKGGDSTSVVATLLDTSNGLENVIGTSTSSFGSDVTNFTQQISNFDYIPGTETLTPHLLRLAVATSGGSFDLTTLATAIFHDSTSITVDEIAFTFPTGITEYMYNSGLVKIENNPIRSNLNLSLNEIGNYYGKLINTKGEVIKVFSIDKKFNSIDMSASASGDYILIIENNKHIVIQTSKLVKVGN